MTLRTFHLATSLLFASLMAFSLVAEAVDTQTPPMLRYERASAMINNGQPIVRLDVWADGQATVWFHKLGRTPGTYTFAIAPDQLASLQSAIGNLEAADFNREAITRAQAGVEQKRRSEAAKSGQPVTVFAVSDDTYSRFGINPNGISAKVDERNTVSLTNLPQLAQQYKSVAALQRWQQIESLALASIEQGQKVAREVRDETQ